MYRTCASLGQPRRILRIAFLLCLPSACGQATSGDSSDIESSSSVTGTHSSATSAAGTGTSSTSSSSETTGAVTTGGSGAAGSGSGSSTSTESSTSTTASVGNGAPCFDDDDCLAPQYCKTPPGRCRQSGQCSDKPSACDANYAPVCGCNGVTYGNRCEAEAAGQDIYVDGSCQDVTDSCITDGVCTGVRHCQRSEECTFGVCGEICHFPEGFCPGDGDPIDPDGVPSKAGTCVARGCEPSLEEDRVCGCDGITYFNSDAAAVKYVSVRHAGACE